MSDPRLQSAKAIGDRFWPIFACEPCTLFTEEMKQNANQNAGANIYDKDERPVRFFVYFWPPCGWSIFVIHTLLFEDGTYRE